MDKLIAGLRVRGVAAQDLHATLWNKEQRKDFIRKWNDGTIKTMVITDENCRGLDFLVDRVIIMDPAEDPGDYLHMVGRTGRLNRKGEALSFVTEDDKETFLNNLAKFLEIVPTEIKPNDGHPGQLNL